MIEEVKAAFKGELQFAGWTDSSKSGPRLTFRLTDRDLIQNFIGCEGKRYACMLVELNDDETPATEPAVPAAIQPAPAKRERMGPLCELAVKLCEEAAFQDWASGSPWWPGRAVSRQQNAKETILKCCGIDSRKQLDVKHEASNVFHDFIRRPYMDWLEERGHS